MPHLLPLIKLVAVVQNRDLDRDPDGAAVAAAVVDLAVGDFFGRGRLGARVGGRHVLGLRVRHVVARY